MADGKGGARVVYAMTDLQRPFERVPGSEFRVPNGEKPETRNAEPGTPLARFKKELIATGVWERPGTEQVMEVSRERMDEWVRKFYEMKAEGIKVPFPYDHSYDSRDNAGFVTELMREGDALYAIIEVPREEDAGLMGTVIQEVSISVNPSFTDGTGRPWGEVIEHVAATTYPVVTGQENFVALARRKDLTTAETQRTQRTEKSESGTVFLPHRPTSRPALRPAVRPVDAAKRFQELRKEQEGSGTAGTTTETTDSTSNSQHSTSNDQGTDDEVEVIALRKNVEKSAALDAAEFLGEIVEKAKEAGGTERRISNIEHRMSKDKGKETGNPVPVQPDLPLAGGWGRVTTHSAPEEVAPGSAIAEGQVVQATETATGCKQPVAHGSDGPGDEGLQARAAQPGAPPEMLAREVRRLREAAVEREMKDLLCEGKITPAQAGAARALLSGCEFRVSGSELMRTQPGTRDSELETAVVFRAFLAAMPRGAAVDFSERTRGLRGLRRAGTDRVQGSGGGVQERKDAGHEELARENLEIAGRGE